MWGINCAGLSWLIHQTPLDITSPGPKALATIRRKVPDSCAWISRAKALGPGVLMSGRARVASMEKPAD
jgi:hypothetical protein